ncbi:hypothetical protein ICU98_08695 [Polynucleobacter sp. MWH-P3-07-1]|uniref:hypothetical protein n=1 Tax=Polynucleobacter sp. MWH-P3-07-1 TaxID=1743173 RepID=UPI001BFE427A|nr:hypothetical protein [Polynucleobacter sp. MWH-P3-07-1]QWD83485.1 hypothetical protein ICU98_08695 [Polynucleobacter sp. MWH-P3-07-1]
MKKFNICLIKPDNYIHSDAFLELGELIYFSLKEIGFEVALQFNQIESSAKNIIIGCHLLDPSLIKQIPPSSIILNTEQIHQDTSDWNKNIFAWVTNFEVWDYSTRNIEKLNEIGIDKVRHFKIGFQQELVRLDNSQDKDVDILFYGSINQRRRGILEALAAKGLKIKTLFGVYGKERDQWIQRSKLVLNHHFYMSQIFEIVRVFYLLTNSIAVVGEVNPSSSINSMCFEGIYPARYDNLVSQCVEVVRNEALRLCIQKKHLLLYLNIHKNYLLKKFLICSSLVDSSIGSK